MTFTIKPQHTYTFTYLSFYLKNKAFIQILKLDIKFYVQIWNDISVICIRTDNNKIIEHIGTKQFLILVFDFSLMHLFKKL